MINDCATCKYAEWDYDDAYGSTIWWVEGCSRGELGCIYNNDDRRDEE